MQRFASYREGIRNALPIKAAIELATGCANKSVLAATSEVAASTRLTLRSYLRYQW